MSKRIPIRRVRANGQVDLLGWYDHAAKEIELEMPGVPLLGTGSHKVDGDLPWVFEEMAPSGFMARRFVDRHPELRLPEQRAHWSADQVLSVITNEGSELAGNLMLGEASFATYLRRRESLVATGVDSEEDIRRYYPEFADDTFSTELRSSLGGDRQKFILHYIDGTELLVKFSPPTRTIKGIRWADLLRMEAQSASVLRDNGVPAVNAECIEIKERLYLEVKRFDRTHENGRIGATTWSGVSSQYGLHDARSVGDALLKDAIITDDESKVFITSIAFSHAIGNGDTHLGNFALLIDDHGHTSLAPQYDVVPMKLAPQYDELPDARLRPLARTEDPRIRAMVASLAARMEADPAITPAFKALWLKLVAANL